MLSKKYRLSAKEIPLVVKKGNRQNFKLFSISSLPQTKPQAKWGLFSVIVSSKISNKATVRNKIKRRLKEAIQKNLTKFRNKKIIFFAKKEILNAKFSDIQNEINNIKTN